MPKHPAPKVAKIEFLDGMRVKIYYDGKTKIVDIGDSDLPERFPKLKEKDFFQKGAIDGGSIAWEDLHIDLDELIYDCLDVSEKAVGGFSKRLLAALTKIINKRKRR